MDAIQPMRSDNTTTDNPGPGRRLRRLETQLETLYQVSRVLSRALKLDDTLHQVLSLLQQHAGLERGLVTLLDPQSGELRIGAVHGGQAPAREVRYRPGEGVLGGIVQQGQTVIIRRLADESRFLNRLGLYDPRRPLIATPIRAEQGHAGVLAAQPPLADDSLPDQARLLELVANLIAQNVSLALEAERERANLVGERDRLRRQVRGQYGFDNIIGRDVLMRRVFEQMRQVAKYTTTVLIRGESGTGKELIANGIHYNSPRANGPFVKLNCAALPDNLLESELFGHEKGAFTGAVSQRKGRFEQAHGGTLFLDELGEISPAFQAKLLRVLQEGEFERVGGSSTLRVDVRIVAATNRDLEAAVEEGEFREDLYYRLNVMPILMPPLRERVGDIADLARFLTGRIGKQQGRELVVTDSALRLLARYDWPGNVRELENCLERAAVMSDDGLIDRDAIALTGIEDKVIDANRTPVPAQVDLNDPDLDERERVIAALEQCGWVQAKAARLLDMTPRQIAYRIQTLNIRMKRL